MSTDENRDFHEMEPPTEVDAHSTTSAPPPLFEEPAAAAESAPDEEPAVAAESAPDESPEPTMVMAMEGVEIPPLPEGLAAPSLDAPPLGSALGAPMEGEPLQPAEEEEVEEEEEEKEPSLLARLGEHVSGYDALLLFAFLALLLGTLAMASELSRYGWERHPKAGRPFSAAADVSFVPPAAV